MLEIINDTLVDAIKLLPFLFVAYLIMEYVEHKTSNKTRKIIQKSGKFGPILGGCLGVFPQCGFSALAANLYAGRVITLGTLIAIFLSTSDEMLPVLISETAPIEIILQVLLMKLIIGIIGGILVDFIINLYRKSKKSEQKERIVAICEHEHCHCEDGNILKSAIKHTINIFLFILLITFIINVIVEYIGKENISNVVLNIPVIGSLISGLVGLIPNCASSIILTELYLEQVISMGSMIGGLLVGSGIGILVLYRANKDLKENLKITGILYIIGIISGLIIDFIGI